MTSAVTNSKRRHDFVLLFDVQDGNPNGDPDAGNLPRVDPETMQGITTDVSLKRKVRDWVDARQRSDGVDTSDTSSGRYKIYVQNSGVALNTKHARAYTELGIKSTGSKQKREDVDVARAWMCENFFDVRMFGAVMSTGVNCGQVRGPVQITFARSIDPIIQLDLSITRVAVTKPEDAVAITSEGDDEKTSGKQTEMGRKAVVPYGLYRAHGFFTPHFAEQTGVTAEDLDLFWQALVNMWDLDHSSSRGMMACRGLYVFSHEHSLGNAPSHLLFERVSVPPSSASAPRAYTDYRVSVDGDNLPAGVTLTRIVG